MGTQGCVSFMFTKKGVLVIEREDLDKDEDTVMSDALEYGASDLRLTKMYLQFTPSLKISAL